MKRVFILLALFTAGLVQGQECKSYKEETIDPLTELSLHVQKPINIQRPGSLYVKAFFSTNHCWIHLNLMIFRLGYARELEFNPQTSLEVYLSDHTEITLYPSADYDAISTPEAIRSIHPSLESSERVDLIRYEISPEQVEILSKASIEWLKINFQPYHYGADTSSTKMPADLFKKCVLSESGRSGVRELASCILKVNQLPTGECDKIQQRKRDEKALLLADEQKISELLNVPFLKIKPDNTEDLKVGDIVQYSTPFGDQITGIVTEKHGKSKVKIKHYPTPGNCIFSEELWKSLYILRPAR